MTREEFENNTSWEMSYEEYQQCNCAQCDKKEECRYRGSFARLPRIDGGLGLCQNLDK